jgi:pyrroloquinoline quinone biosynthesis protein B
MSNQFFWKGLTILISPFFLSQVLFAQTAEVKLLVLGVMQDGGLPQLGCNKSCCANAPYRKSVASLAIVNAASRQYTLIDATPDIIAQSQLVNSMFAEASIQSVFLTHAHIGHYTGLMQLGREAMNAKNVQVYAMPRLLSFLSTNGPWNQLVQLKNIELQSLQNDLSVQLDGYTITPLLVPHRDEYSETVGFRIKGIRKSLLYIPDIDKWSKWNRQLIQEIEKVDYAFLDGTFYADGEVNRPMSEIPHPFVTETIELLRNVPLSIRQRVYFTHFNHTNPLINPSNSVGDQVRKLGFQLAKEGTLISL